MNGSGKHSTLLRYSKIYGSKRFINQGLYYKTFYSCNYSCNVIRWSVCQCHSLSPLSNICGTLRLARKYQTWVDVNGCGKHSTLLRYSKIYGYKRFINQGPIQLTLYSCNCCCNVIRWSVGQSLSLSPLRLLDLLANIRLGWK